MGRLRTGIDPGSPATSRAAMELVDDGKVVGSEIPESFAVEPHALLHRRSGQELGRASVQPRSKTAVRTGGFSKFGLHQGGQQILGRVDGQPLQV